MPIYRVTYGFAGNGVGSSETHMLTSQLTNARAVIATLAPFEMREATCSRTPSKSSESESRRTPTELFRRRE